MQYPSLVGAVVIGLVGFLIGVVFF
jgi:preprotein translocase subunit Sss1